VQHAVRSCKRAQPWIRNNDRRTPNEPLNLTLDCEHAHVSGRSSRPTRRQGGECRRRAVTGLRWHDRPTARHSTSNDENRTMVGQGFWTATGYPAG
jgi:hypothetical protein